MLLPLTIQCPYCFEQLVLWLPPDEVGEMVTDCEVCCRPIRFKVHLNLEGQVLDFSVFPTH